jgi:deoxycytidylate deaminase
MTQERQQKYDEIYMKIAKTISELSYANRNKVGCVIVSADGQLIS